MSGRRHLGIVAAGATLLASAPLLAIFDRWTWLIQCAVAIAAIAAAAAGIRAMRAPLWTQPPAMLGALVVALTWLFPSGKEFLGLLPTASTLEHFGALLGQVPAAMRDHAVPVPDTDPLLFVTAVGVGLVAILVDLCAVGLRRPALAGLPMLAIYSVPVAVRFDSVHPIPFIIGAFGFLWLLGADNVDRVRRFGRRFTGDGRDVDVWEPSPLAAAGRRLTVLGVLVAVVLPLAVPGMTTGLFDRFGGGFGPGTGPGDGRSPASVNLFAELYGQLNTDTSEDLVRVTTDDPSPYYLRLGISDQINDEGFTPPRLDGQPVSSGLPVPATGAGPGIEQRSYRAQVEILALDMPMAPTWPELVEISGLDSRWLYDPAAQVVYSNRSASTGLSYEFEYVRSEFSPDALRRAAPLPADHQLQRQFTEVPAIDQVQEEVDRIVDGFDRPYDKAAALHEYFSRRNGFRYSLQTGPETTGSAIVDFLANQTGFCVQYAAALAWMARTADLPARVAIGFTRGSNRAEDTYTLTNRNLHAWTEIYLDGFGWVPFDATPSGSVAGSVDPDWAPNPDAVDPADPAEPGQTPSDGSTPFPGDGTQEEPPFADAPGGGAGALPTESNWARWSLGVLGLLLALLALPALERLRLRRRRTSRRLAGASATGAAPGLAAAGPADAGPADAGPADGEPTAAAAGVVTSTDPHAAARQSAYAAWDELLDTMVDYQLPLDPSETPRATARRLVQQVRLTGPSADGTHLLGQAEERARYARTALAPDGFVAALRAARRELAGESARPTRVRAILLPPSTLLRWRLALGRSLTRVTDAASRLTDGLARHSPRRLLRGTRPSI